MSSLQVSKRWTLPAPLELSIYIVYGNASTVLKVDPRWDPLEGTDVTLTCESQNLKLQNRTVDPVEWFVVFPGSRIETILAPTNATVLPTGN